MVAHRSELWGGDGTDVFQTTMVMFDSVPQVQSNLLPQLSNRTGSEGIPPLSGLQVFGIENTARESPIAAKEAEFAVPFDEEDLEVFPFPSREGHGRGDAHFILHAPSFKVTMLLH